jgi:hypothetical protein
VARSGRAVNRSHGRDLVAEDQTSRGITMMPPFVQALEIDSG